MPSAARKGGARLSIFFILYVPDASASMPAGTSQIFVSSLCSSLTTVSAPAIVRCMAGSVAASIDQVNGSGENRRAAVQGGASRHVWPSGMCRDMGLGLEAYNGAIGERQPPPDLVGIFEAGPDVAPVSVQEQRAYAQAALAAFKR
jgi:hypothetical protein